MQSVVKTQSYVAFMRIPKLASLLLFEYLEVRKLEDASAAGAAGGSNLLLHGFCTFVSSSGRVCTLADADVPVRCAQPTVVQGLRCLARLPTPAFELMGPIRTVRDLCFEAKPNAMAETYERKSNAKDSWEPLEDVHVACKAIFDKLGHEILNKDCVSPFAGPTHPEVPELGDYAKIVHEPMDFGIIKERLDSGQYAVYGELPAEDAAFQWQSKSGKSQSLPRRSTGDSFEGERVCGAGFAMDKLKQTFDESRKKVLTAAGAASTLNSAFGTLWIEPDWAQFEAPANVPSKLTILFVGVDNGSAKDPDLNLKAEYMNISPAC